MSIKSVINNIVETSDQQFREQEAVQAIARTLSEGVVDDEDKQEMLKKTLTWIVASGLGEEAIQHLTHLINGREY